MSMVGHVGRHGELGQSKEMNSIVEHLFKSSVLLTQFTLIVMTNLHESSISFGDLPRAQILVVWRTLLLPYLGQSSVGQL